MLDFFTTMTELKGHEEAAGARRALGRPGRYQLGRKSWRHRRAMEALELGVTRQPYCVIVGAGQAGVALAARLKRLDVPTLVIDRRERPSDTWRERHDSLSLHSPSWVDHMPYFPYPETWPVHPSKDQFADWLDAYAVLMELDIWTRADCKSARFVENAGEWLVEVEHQGRTVMLRPKQLVFADGLVGTPRTPVIQGAELFKGIQRHAAAHRGSEEFAGRNCVVVGAGTSAHDICAELWEAGAQVTMVQRSPVIVERSERLVAFFASLFGEEAKARGISTETGDLLAASIPFRMLLQMHQQRVAELREQDAGFHEQLRKAGFHLTFGEDEAGIFAQILRDPTGYYLDVGASALIIDGSIRLRSGVGISALETHHAVLSDGSRLAADLIVYATGYDRGPGPSALSEETRRNVGLVWGFGSGVRGDPGPWEGELRNMWKPTAQPGLWFHKAGIGQSQFYSRLLALQIKARHAGLPTPVYAAPAPRADLSTASSG